MPEHRKGAYLLILLILTPLLCQTVQATHNNNENTTIKDLLRGFKVEFTPPETILDCGSLFFLDVKLTKIRVFPTTYSISVYLKTTTKFGATKITRIGLLPYVYTKPFNRNELTISIPCFTTNDLFENIYCLRSNEKQEVIFKDAEIGIQIDKAVKWGFYALIWNAFINNDFALKNILLSYDADLSKKIFINDKPTLLLNIFRKIGFISISKRIGSFLKNRNPLIVWKETEVISPFVSSDRFSFRIQKYKKITDDEGNFYVTAKIYNNLSRKICYCVCADIFDEPLVYNIIPTLSGTIYNVGVSTKTIEPGSDPDIINLSCKFPEGTFYHRNYTVTIGCYPYIYINNTNQFGIFFYDLRHRLFIDPFYESDEECKNDHRKLWYNLPIFSPRGSESIFPVESRDIYYNATTSEDIVSRAIKTISSEVRYWIYIYFFFTFLIISFSFIVYWFINKNLKVK